MLTGGFFVMIIVESQSVENDVFKEIKLKNMYTVYLE